LRIFVAMPAYRTPETIGRAVSSILGQTHRDLLLVVLNDGDDPASAWAPLAHVTDPRLVRFDLSENRGWPFADAVALAACDAPWFSPHDSDDWSDPRRLELLLALSAGADVVLQDEAVHRQNGSSILVPVQPYRPDGVFRHHAVRAGLYRTEWLRRIGGIHPSFRLGYDTLLTSLAFLAGETRVLREPLYHRVKRAGSLTSARETGMGSPVRAHVRARLAALWRECFRVARGAADRAAAVGDVIRRSIAPADAAAVEYEATRLRALLSGRRAAA
jgi:glycosyltransferase involved in cell wall biosynthesis